LERDHYTYKFQIRPEYFSSRLEYRAAKFYTYGLIEKILSGAHFTQGNKCVFYLGKDKVITPKDLVDYIRNRQPEDSLILGKLKFICGVD